MVIGHLLFWRMMGRIEERQRAAALVSMIRASAPGRAGIVGNPTDGYGGTVISTSLAERATVRITGATASTWTSAATRRRSAASPTWSWRTAHRYRQGGAEDLSGRGAAGPVPADGDDGHPDAGGAGGLDGDAGGAAGRGAPLPRDPAEPLRDRRAGPPDRVRPDGGHLRVPGPVHGGLRRPELSGFPRQGPQVEDDPVFATVESLEEVVPRRRSCSGTPACSAAPARCTEPSRPLAGRRAADRTVQRIGRLAREAKALLAGDWRCLGETMNENHAIQRDLGAAARRGAALIAAATRGRWARSSPARPRGDSHRPPPRTRSGWRAPSEAGAVNVMRVIPAKGWWWSPSIESGCPSCMRTRARR